MQWGSFEFSGKLRETHFELLLTSKRDIVPIIVLYRALNAFRIDSRPKTNNLMVNTTKLCIMVVYKQI